MTSSLERSIRAKELALSRGYVHSTFPGSSVDGPGVRFVIWLAGCAFRCQYCHNPDTWHLHDGKLTSIDQIMDQIRPYEHFLKSSRGGVTISGGEPLVQAEFVLQLADALRGHGLHVALDTNGFYGSKLVDSEWELLDLVLLDIKSFLPETHLLTTEQPVEPVLATAKRLSDLGRPTWIRFVMVPGLTDQPENVAGLAEFVSELRNVQRVEVLPFHQMGQFKWRGLGLDYRLADTSPPSFEEMERVREAFRRTGVLTV